VTDEHVEELAALYALGALSDHERAAIDAHLRHCLRCAQAIGAAERDVTVVAAHEAQRTPPAELAARIDRLFAPPLVRSLARAHRPVAWAQGTAIAAAFLLGLLPSLYLWNQIGSMRGALVTQNAVMERLASAPHRTVAFQPMQPSPPAQVMYAPDGSWYVVVVRDASKALSVAWMHDGQRTMLGSAAPRGNFAMLYLPKSHRMDRLALIDGDQIVAEATLTWQRTGPAPRAVRSS
jgi:hypothetical protein